MAGQNNDHITSPGQKPEELLDLLEAKDREVAEAVAAAFHPDRRLVAEHGGALVCRNYPQANPTRTFHSVSELNRAISQYVRENNRKPRPFIWAATAAGIMKKINFCKKR